MLPHTAYKCIQSKWAIFCSSLVTGCNADHCSKAWDSKNPMWCLIVRVKTGSDIFILQISHRIAEHNIWRIHTNEKTTKTISPISWSRDFHGDCFQCGKGRKMEDAVHLVFRMNQLHGSLYVACVFDFYTLVTFWHVIMYVCLIFHHQNVVITRLGPCVCVVYTRITDWLYIGVNLWSRWSTESNPCLYKPLSISRWDPAAFISY